MKAVQTNPMPSVNSPRGTRDILPIDQPLWQHVVRTCQDVAERLSYQQISLPTFEELGLYQRAIGTGTDIMDKELFFVGSRHTKEQHYALRPEGTAGMVRAYIQHGMQSWPQPVKLYSILNLFRYERPQRGRFREHTQFDIEYFGDNSPFADAWIVLTHWQVLQTLHISGVRLSLNNLGTAEERQAYRTALISFLEPLKDSLSDDSKRRLIENPLRILDSKDPGDRQLLTNAPKLSDSLGQASNEHFTLLQNYLESWQIPFSLDPLLVRGLDYYSLSCFEWVHTAADGSQLSVGGGGRYDGMLPLLGGPQTGAVGAGLGLDRLVDLLEVVPPTQLDIFVVLADPMALPSAQRLIAQLAGLLYKFDADFSKSSLGSQLKAAAKRQARYAIIVGLDGSTDWTVRNLSDGEQHPLAASDLSNETFA